VSRIQPIPQISLKGISKIAFLSSIGTYAEYYDLFVAVTAAALVWPKIFFQGYSPTVAAALSLLSFAATELSRPLGALIFGSLGDRRGRPKTLSFTLAVMFLGVAGIAVLPTTAQIGVAAIVLLLAFRAIQGIGLGGEWGGAVSWVAEFVPQSRWRTFITGWVQNSVHVGLITSSLLFALLSGSLSQSDLLNWGWRIPFAVGSFILVIAAIVRYRTAESPLFKILEERNLKEESPIKSTFRNDLKPIISLAAMWAYIAAVPGLLVAGPFVLGYLTNTSSISASSASLTISIAFAFGILANLLGSILGDLLGKKRVIVLSNLLTLLFLYPYFLLVSPNNWLLSTVGVSLLFVAITLGEGVIAALFVEQFPTGRRYSGAGMAYNIGGFSNGVAIGFVQPFLIAIAGGLASGIIPSLAFGAAFSIVSLISLKCISEKGKIE